VGTSADIAVRIGTLNDSSLTQRRLGQVQPVLVASPAYLARAEPLAGPQSLQAHALIVADPLQQWELRHVATDARFVLQAAARFRVTNEMNVAVAMASAGIGILFCPLTQCHRELESGELVRLLPDWAAPPRDVYAVWSQQRYLPARVRALLDHLVEFAQSHPLLAGGSFLDQAPRR
jgi:LysR family transcriptional regulator AphB